MYPINNIEGIQQQEKALEGSHAIILLFVKPSDRNADEIISNINYLHHRSYEYCSIYLVGYGQEMQQQYRDCRVVEGVDNQTWQYSDTCFIEVCNQLERRLKNWFYCGEPEMIILQNSTSMENGKLLDFRNYHYIDINYGLNKGYIDSFSRFMERIIWACRRDVTAHEVVVAASRKRLNCRSILEGALNLDRRLPEPVKEVLTNKLFFKSSYLKN